MGFKIIKSWWYSWQLQQSLKQEKYQRANYLLEKLKSLDIKLPLLAKLYQKNIEIANSLERHEQKRLDLKKNLKHNNSSNNYLTPDLNFTLHVRQVFKFVEEDKYKLQVTGINKNIFDNLENALADFIETEIGKVSVKNRSAKLQEALNDLLSLRKGIDPSYNYYFSPHIYLLKYFPENVYCTYLAWFLVYKSGLLPRNLKILDLAAGPGTIIYGLSLLLSSTVDFYTSAPVHISYYSLERQAALQYRGLQFWRSYMESLASPANAYFRFNTLNIFDYSEYASKLPRNFFNFITISHCFFYDSQQRQESHQIYRQICDRNLRSEGYVLLIVQGRKLFKTYDVFPTEDIAEERMVIDMFLAELGLQLKWYKYLTSTGKRTPIKTSFGKFARENLPPQNYLGNTRKQYLKENFIANYAIDDYVILAQKVIKIQPA